MTELKIRPAIPACRVDGHKVWQLTDEYFLSYVSIIKDNEGDWVMVDATQCNDVDTHGGTYEGYFTHAKPSDKEIDRLIDVYIDSYIDFDDDIKHTNEAGGTQTKTMKNKLKIRLTNPVVKIDGFNVWQLTKDNYESYISVYKDEYGDWLVAEPIECNDPNTWNYSFYSYFTHSDLPSDEQIDRLVDSSGVSSIAFSDNDKHTNEAGGTQTRLPVRCDLLPSDVLLEIAKVLAEGADKYGANNWKLIEVDDHINHALTHVYRFQTGDISEPHLVHALCRLMFAAHLENRE